jgi:hypothetical protein
MSKAMSASGKQEPHTILNIDGTIRANWNIKYGSINSD